MYRYFMRVHYTYKITFPEKGLYYFGKHSTKNLRDGYRGSGKLTKELIREGHVYEVELIALHETSPAAYLHEQTLIGDRWKNDHHCINRMPGGKSRYTFGVPRNPEWNRKIGESNRKPRKDKAKVLMAAKLGAEARRGQKDSLEVRMKRGASVSASTLGKPKPWMCKRIQVDDKIFVGIDAAAKEFGLNRHGVRVRLKSDKHPTWKEIKNER